MENAEEVKNKNYIDLTSEKSFYMRSKTTTNKEKEATRKCIENIQNILKRMSS